MHSFPAGGCAVVLGATGAIGGAIAARLAADPAFARVIGFGRRTAPPLELTDEASVAACAEAVRASGLEPRLVFDATGFLHDERFQPEKGLAAVTPGQLARHFAVNAIGPALLMKHLLPLLPRQGKSVFATLSAKVGSIGDNQLGGWHGYRASKAALNQLVRCAAIELARKRREAVCVALHPGTVDTPLSAPFGKDGLTVRAPDEAAERLLEVLDGLGAADTGRFLAYDGSRLPW